jgi:hypothetical protein
VLIDTGKVLATGWGITGPYPDNMFQAWQKQTAEKRTWAGLDEKEWVGRHQISFKVKALTILSTFIWVENPRVSLENPRVSLEHPGVSLENLVQVSCCVTVYVCVCVCVIGAYSFIFQVSLCL